MTVGWAHHLKSSHRANSRRHLGNGNETLSSFSRRHHLLQSKCFLSSVRLAMQSWECRTLMRSFTFTVYSLALHDCLIIEKSLLHWFGKDGRSQKVHGLMIIWLALSYPNISLWNGRISEQSHSADLEEMVDHKKLMGLSDGLWAILTFYCEKLG